MSIAADRGVGLWRSTLSITDAGIARVICERQNSLVVNFVIRALMRFSVCNQASLLLGTCTTAEIMVIAGAICGFVSRQVVLARGEIRGFGLYTSSS